MSDLTCRLCAAPLWDAILDLGMSPPSNSLLTSDRLNEPETFYPLRAYLCHSCWLVQLPQYRTPEETFSEYAYFSSYSSSWNNHVREYAHMARQRFQLGPHSLVVEIASNDGHLLQGFKEAQIPVLGIEPARNVAAVAVKAGVPTMTDFFGTQLARALRAGGKSADLVVANNVLAHVADLNDFVAGIWELLKPGGVATFEFPHLARLIERTEFDTIYHEHLCYFSLLVVQQLFAAHGLMVFDVDELATHGGSLRVYACRSDHKLQASHKIERMVQNERDQGFDSDRPFRDFQARVRAAKLGVVRFLLDAASRGEAVAGYGAPAKATTLLNYCGVGPDLISFTVDRNPYKQGKFIPGVRIPIREPEAIKEAKPAYVFVLPWNIADEVMSQMAEVRSWNGKFVIPIPSLAIR